MVLGNIDKLGNSTETGRLSFNQYAYVLALVSTEYQETENLSAHCGSDRVMKGQNWHVFR